MGVPLPPRKRAKRRRRPTGQPRLLLDARWSPGDRRYHVSVEWYWDDLQQDPESIEVWGAGFSILAIVTRLAEMLEAISKGARPPNVIEELDLRDPPHD